MSLIPIKKINNNIATPLNELIWNKLSGYYGWGYNLTGNSNWTAPYTATYKINAYMVNNTTAGRGDEFAGVTARLTSGQKIQWNISNYGVNVKSPNYPNFVMYMNRQGVTVNAQYPAFKNAIAAGGMTTSGNYEHTVQVRCDNGIALGHNGAYNAGNGQSAYAWGNNVYAIGGGGSGDGRVGGRAYVNGEEVTTPCVVVNNRVELVSGYGRDGAVNTTGLGGVGTPNSYAYNYISDKISLISRRKSMPTYVLVPKFGNYLGFHSGFNTSGNYAFLTIEIVCLS